MALLKEISRGIRRDRRGAAAVEFALALPVYLLCTYSLIEVGRLIYTQGAVTFAAEEATRYATVHYDATIAQLKQAATDKIFALNSENIKAVDVRTVLDPADHTKRVTVELSYRHDLLVPLLPGGSVILEGASRGFLVEK